MPLEPVGLPIVWIGGLPFYDIRGIVGPDFRPRARTEAIDLHHSVGAAVFPDLNFSGTNADEEIAHIRAIDLYHRDVNGWDCGFGYQAIGFPQTGRVYVVGEARGQRAHVRGRNHLDVGIVFAGSYVGAELPNLGVIAGARFTLAMMREHGLIAVRGHRQAPGQQTQCPGSGVIDRIPDMLRVAVWLHKIGG